MSSTYFKVSMDKEKPEIFLYLFPCIISWKTIDSKIDLLWIKIVLCKFVIRKDIQGKFSNRSCPSLFLVWNEMPLQFFNNGKFTGHNVYKT